MFIYRQHTIFSIYTIYGMSNTFPHNETVEKPADASRILQPDIEN